MEAIKEREEKIVSNQIKLRATMNEFGWFIISLNNINSLEDLFIF